MKRRLVFTLFLILSAIISAQNKNPNYDPALAQKYGADEYGMKTYILVILKTGSNNVTDKVQRDSLFAGHQKNIRRLANLGKLVVAGPLFENDKSYQGIFILDVQSLDEAGSLLESDPTIKGKVFETELYQFYGSAALPAYMDISDRIWQIHH